MTAALRTALTLAVLTLLVVVAVAWGFHQTIRPFPKSADVPICTDTEFAEGDPLSTDQVTVNVLNAGTREGLASRTMQLLTDQGFAQGVSQNAPGGTQVAGAEIWTSDRANPAIGMLRTFVGKVPVRVRTDLPYAGLDLVVGDQFGDLAAGRSSLTLRRGGTICTPTAG